MTTLNTTKLESIKLQAAREQLAAVQSDYDFQSAFVDYLFDHLPEETVVAEVVFYESQLAKFHQLQREVEQLTEAVRLAEAEEISEEEEW
jgi:hypothetical protein